MLRLAALPNKIKKPTMYQYLPSSPFLGGSQTYRTKGIDKASQVTSQTLGSTDQPIKNVSTGTSMGEAYSPALCFRETDNGNQRVIEYETTWDGSCLGGERDLVVTACLGAEARDATSGVGDTNGWFRCTVEHPIRDGPKVNFAFNPSYSTFYTPPGGEQTRIDGSLKIEIGPSTVGEISVIYDGPRDPKGDPIVNVKRPFGLKSPFSGTTLNGEKVPDPMPLDVSLQFGVAAIVGNWDQHSKSFFSSN